jgi:precorrin-2 methylase
MLFGQMKASVPGVSALNALRARTTIALMSGM